MDQQSFYLIVSYLMMCCSPGRKWYQDKGKFCFISLVLEIQPAIIQSTGLYLWFYFHFQSIVQTCDCISVVFRLFLRRLCSVMFTSGWRTNCTSWWSGSLSSPIRWLVINCVNLLVVGGPCYHPFLRLVTLLVKAVSLLNVIGAL